MIRRLAWFTALAVAFAPRGTAAQTVPRAEKAPAPKTVNANVNANVNATDNATDARLPATGGEPPNADIAPGPLAVAAAVGPGFLWSGLGTRIAGDRESGRKLLRLKGAGLAVLLAGGIPFAISGASRRTSGFALPLILAGSGGFFGSWWADIYGAATGGRAATARLELPALEAELGYGTVFDPQFDYRHFATAAAWARYRRWTAAGRAWVAGDDNTQRFELSGSYRLFGPAPDGVHPLGLHEDGTFLDIEAGGILHRQADDGFTVYTPTVSVRGRYDMQRVGRSLAGSFLDLSVGFGLELYDIDNAGVSPVSLQLARFGYGLYLGGGGTRYGELVAYYDHRHDEFAAGAGTGGVFDGPWGHVGVEGFYYLTRTWGLSAEFEVGSAYVTRLSARFAWGHP